MRGSFLGAGQPYETGIAARTRTGLQATCRYGGAGDTGPDA
jgi:hypothetical protein